MDKIHQDNIESIRIAPQVEKMRFCKLKMIFQGGGEIIFPPSGDKCQK